MTSVVNGIGPQFQSIKDVYQRAGIVAALVPAYENATNDHVLYECDICGAYHPWDWDGDCRDDENRYAGIDLYAERHHVPEYHVEVRSMDERITADGN